MKSNIVTTSEVRAALKPLGHAQLQRLSALSSVSFTTLCGIRSGQRLNPGIETVGKFMRCLDEVRKPVKA